MPWSVASGNFTLSVSSPRRSGPTNSDAARPAPRRAGGRGAAPSHAENAPPFDCAGEDGAHLRPLGIHHDQGLARHLDLRLGAGVAFRVRQAKVAVLARGGGLSLPCGGRRGVAACWVSSSRSLTSAVKSGSVKSASVPVWRSACAACISGNATASGSGLSARSSLTRSAYLSFAGVCRATSRILAGGRAGGFAVLDGPIADVLALDAQDLLVGGEFTSSVSTPARRIR